MTDKELLNIAFEAAQNGYAPRSGVRVGAALECGDGSVYTGCNVENALPRLDLCAEHGAVAAAVAAGKRDFRRIAVVPSAGEDFRVPCGLCRQVLAEFSKEMEVLCARPDGRYVSYRVSELLPHAARGWQDT